MKPPVNKVGIKEGCLVVITFATKWTLTPPLLLRPQCPHYTHLDIFHGSTSRNITTHNRGDKVTSQSPTNRGARAWDLMLQAITLPLVIHPKHQTA